MDYTHRLKQANAIPNAPPTRGQYDESAIRAGALELTVARQRATIQAQRAEIERLNDEIQLRDDLSCAVIGKFGERIAEKDAEIERLNGAIGELEQEGLELEARDFLRQREIDDRHNALETPRSGQTENFWR